MPGSLADRLRIAALLLIPALLFVGLYWRSLDYDFVWTDQGEIESGHLILPPGEIHTAFGRPMLTGLENLAPGMTAPYYRPLQVVAASWIDYDRGRQPGNFRALNLLLGALTSISVAWLALMLLRRTDAAVVAGCVFAAHPANIENYVWIAGLSHALAALFISVSLLLGVAALQTMRRGVWIAASAGSLVALLLALLSKENAAVTPLLLIAASISLVVRESRQPAPGQDATQSSLPGFRVRAIGLCALQVLLAAVFVLLWRPHVLGGMLAEAAPLFGSWRVQILTAIAHWPDAMMWLLLPLQSNTSDVVVLVGSPLHPKVLLGVALAGGSLWLWLRMLRGGAEVAAFALAWIWIAFAPTSGLVPLNHMHGERYLALSLFGLALLLPALMGMLRERLPGGRGERVAVIVSLLLVLGLAQRTWQRIPDWRSDLTLFSSDVSRDPLYREGYHELAKAHVEEGDMRSAQAVLEDLNSLGEAVSGTTGFFRHYDMMDLHCQVNLALGEPERSRHYFEKLEPDSPDVSALPQLSLCAARTLHAVGQGQRALGILETLYGIGPSPWRTEVVLSAAEIQLAAGRTGDARSWLERLDRSQIQDPDQLYRWTGLRGRLQSPGE